MAKRYAVLISIVILLANFTLPSYAFDKERLLKLDPLVSKRLEKLADNSRNARNNLVLNNLTKWNPALYQLICHVFCSFHQALAIEQICLKFILS